MTRLQVVDVGYPGTMRTNIALAGLALLIVITGCSRRDDDRSIKAAPEQAAAAAASAAASPAAPGASAPVANPLAMPLKHDGPAAATATDAAVDPCAVTEPTGALAMPLKHGAAPQRNPLCMKLK
jgi:hypothetical protein